MTDSAIRVFIDRLASVETGPGCRNFFDRTVPANARRRRNLEIYLLEMLNLGPRVLLVGEAPGFRGMRITGVPFTDRTILEGPTNRLGLFGPGKGYVLPAGFEGIASEPTATVMWQVLVELESLPLLWSAYPFHTHVPGRPLSNRTPTLTETAVGVPFLADASGDLRHPDSGGGGERGLPQPAAKRIEGAENQASGPRRQGRI
ncbi:hypothetical protein [Arthrobacter sp. UYCu712]|uniref:hypothetical protein n=1 Tax=Arthrobacter sp. UYCu712 TaxID=3156340 RepID=UPI0033921C94